MIISKKKKKCELPLVGMGAVLTSRSRLPGRGRVYHNLNEEADRLKRDVDEITRIAERGTGEELKAALERLGRTLEWVDDVHNGKKTMSLIQVACSQGNLSTAKALLELGGSPLGRGPTDPCACSPGSHWTFPEVGAVTSLLTAHEARASWTCMHLAATADSIDILKLLLTHGYGDLVHAQTEDALRLTPLMAVTTRCNGLYRPRRYTVREREGQFAQSILLPI